MIALFIVTFVIYSGVTKINGSLDFNHMILGRYGILYLVQGITGSMLILSLSYFIDNLSKALLLKWCGVNSLFLMVSHLPFGIMDFLKSAEVQFIHADKISFVYYAGSVSVMVVLLIIEYLLNEVRLLIKKKLSAKCRFLKYI